MTLDVLHRKIVQHFGHVLFEGGGKGLVSAPSSWKRVWSLIFVDSGTILGLLPIDCQGCFSPQSFVGLQGVVVVCSSTCSHHPWDNGTTIPLKHKRSKGLDLNIWSYKFSVQIFFIYDSSFRHSERIPNRQETYNRYCKFHSNAGWYFIYACRKKRSAFLRREKEKPTHFTMVSLIMMERDDNNFASQLSMHNTIESRWAKRVLLTR